MQSFPSDVLTSIKQHLEEEKKRVLARINELSVQDPFSDPERTNDNAASDAEANEESSHDRFAALIAQLKQQLSDIDAALLRVAHGTYGFCSKCGEMIDTDRLSILPTAILCLSCEKKKAK
ncbi:MAG: TraR/DksA family transcriptional regulator [Patescibacteria group bacterium]